MDTFKNLVIAQVVTPPSPPTTGLSLTLTPGAGAAMPPVPFTVTVFDGAAYATPTNAELVRVTAVVGDTLSGLVRGIESSTPRAIVAGDYVAQTFTAQMIADLRDSSNQNAGILPDARLSANVQMKPLPPVVPAAHHTTHEPGGADALVALDAATLTTGKIPVARLPANVALTDAGNIFIANQTIDGGALLQIRDPAAGTDQKLWWLRSLNGLLYFQAVNDAGNTQTGVVTIDHTGVLGASAGFGGTPLNASQLITGTVPDARLSTNVALKNTANSFSANQALEAWQPRLKFNDFSQAANLRRFEIANLGQELNVWSLDDAEATIIGRLRLTRGGDLILTGSVTEKGRLTPMGHWIDVPFNAANFAMSSGGMGTWTVGAGAIISNRYTLVGKTMIWSIYISWFSGSNTFSDVSGTAGIILAIPGGFASYAQQGNAVSYLAAGATLPSHVWASISGAGIVIKRIDGGGFPNGAIGLITTFTFEIG